MPITRREALKVLGGSLAAGTLAQLVGFHSLFAQGERKPNIVLYLTDDHGYLDSGCYGNTVVKTPNVDRLAREGIRFTGAFVPSPTCTPSRSSLLTGLYPFRHGAHPNHSSIHPNLKTLPAYFSEIGYRTVHECKSDVRPRGAFPWDSTETRANPDMRRIDKILAEPGEKPFFLYVCSRAPHVPWPRKSNYDPAAIVLPSYIDDTPKQRDRVARYYAAIDRMERELGHLLKLLDDHKMVDNTIFIYASDNGAQLPHAKWELYDAGIHMPLVIRWTGKVKPGAVTDAMVSYVDLLPTLLEAGGGKAPADIDGRSFLGVLKGKTNKHRDIIFATHTKDNKLSDFPMRCVRTHTHKYILNLATTSGGYFRDKRVATEIDGVWTWPKEELYDLRTDPHELKNVAADPAQHDTLVTLRAKLEEIRKQQGEI